MERFVAPLEQAGLIKGLTNYHWWPQGARCPENQPDLASNHFIARPSPARSGYNMRTGVKEERA
jgi:hypothetical protein